ncbi:MAG TPA: hypothetical protein VF092_28630 [Longimicrobium sp.]
MIRIISIAFALLVCAGSVSAQQNAPLNVASPPVGSMTREQLLAVARDIHRLEASPLAPDAAAARQELFAWLSESPDVTISVCHGVIGELPRSRSAYHDLLLLQFVLSSGAYAIEHPDADAGRVALGGLEGIMATYAALEAQQGARARDEVMERFAELRAGGRLEAFAREGALDCD